MAKIDDRMEIGLCWGTLQGADLTELIEAAGRHGFPTLSVRPDMILAHVLDGPGERDLRRRLADTRVRVTVIDALSSGLPGMKGGTEASGGVEACFRAAEAVDCLLINVTLYGGEPAPLDEVAAALGQVSRRAAEWGQGLVLEFVPDTGVPDLATARQVVEAVGETNFRIMLDPWHLARSGGTLADVLSLPPGMIGGFQLDDRIPPPGRPMCR